jgi:hypothetical protein
MNEEFERIWKEAIIAQMRYYSSICLEGLWKSIKTPRTAGVPAYKTKHLQNRSIESYCYADLVNVHHTNNETPSYVLTCTIFSLGPNILLGALF